MGEVIENIVSNAIKHTSSGDSTRLDTSLTDESLTMKITDSGAGFEEQELSTVFTKYHKEATVTCIN
ncbi:ATP-binding protein [Brevibacillus laterosporus]|uniref:ATP-binding protein n=1 Tax=Brevibacillus laterosporus TaxID=1465 RepID=UPI00264EDF09|nr:ATP-binding protein [Brevibacillus laterosporus]MDN9009474.1 ATP-binding protein [Brevibacillus laterosporus]MDO0940527.1 ATP-binding protein [Brevibacillus laterosporus]